jgi:hypothetical protein
MPGPRRARFRPQVGSCQKLAQRTHPIAGCLGRAKPTAAKVIKLIEMAKFDFVVQRGASRSTREWNEQTGLPVHVLLRLHVE